MFRGRAQSAGFIPREGDKVEVRALVTLYGARGDYQINVEAIRRAGVGALYEAFLRLKEKLAAQGMFDPDRKRPLPLFTRSVGIVTSPQRRRAARRADRAAPARAACARRAVPDAGAGPGRGRARLPRRSCHGIAPRAKSTCCWCAAAAARSKTCGVSTKKCVARAIAACSMPVIAGRRPRNRLHHRRLRRRRARRHADRRRRTGRHAARRLAGVAAWRRHSTCSARCDRRLSDASQGLDNLSRRLLSPSAQIGHQRLKLLALATAMTHAVQAAPEPPGTGAGAIAAALEPAPARHARTAGTTGIGRPPPAHEPAQQPQGRVAMR